MFEKAKEKLGKFTSGEFVQEHVSEAIQSISELAPLLKKNGYTIQDIELELGLPTGIAVTFRRNENVTEELSKLLEECEGEKIKSWIIKSILKVNQMQEMFKKGKLEIFELKIGIKIPPSVSVKLKPIETK